MKFVNSLINLEKKNLLEDGDQLPGSRKIAEELQVHRKTIVAALMELEGQGWVDIIPNIGTFVKNPDLSLIKPLNVRVFRQPPEKALFQFRRESILDIPILEIPERLCFTDGTPDYRIIGTEELVRFYASVLKRKK